jgi:hypothetical protein
VTMLAYPETVVSDTIVDKDRLIRTYHFATVTPADFSPVKPVCGLCGHHANRGPIAYAFPQGECEFELYHRDCFEQAKVEL